MALAKKKVKAGERGKFGCNIYTYRILCLYIYRIKYVMYVCMYIYIYYSIFSFYMDNIYIYTSICMNMHSNDQSLDLLSVCIFKYTDIAKHINTSIVAMVAFKHPNSPPLFHHGIDPRTGASKGEVCELHGVFFFPVACQIKSYHSLSSIKEE